MQSRSRSSLRRFSAVSLCALLLPAALCAQLPAPGLKVPPGFEVIEFADGKLANDIYCMTIDPKGRIVVSGRGYIRILVDDDGDGRADRAIEFAAEPKDGAMGMLWEGDTLYATGDGGLRRFLDKNGDGKADGPSQLLRALRTGSEHGAHALRRGPDGWLYLLCGNNSGINRSYADLPDSPIKEPIAGCVLRFTPDLQKCAIVAHGFRNAYGMDFNLDGELFTFDSDNERCVSLPWYEPTRFYHVIAGGHYGWLSPQQANFWRRPPYFCDVVAPLATLGRGSPTGVTCYRHNQFPAAYHGGMFLCDWTFGKIHFATLQRQGASYRCRTEVFLESLGDNGFAPTACVVHPQTGDLYVSIGGRGTRGAVYRIRHTERFNTLKSELAPLKTAPRSHESYEVWKNKYAEVQGSKTALEQGLLLLRKNSVPAQRLEGIRVVQLVLGDIGAKKSIGTLWEGYSPRHESADPETATKLAALFPSGDANLDRELARTLGMLRCADEDLRLRVLGQCSPESSPIDDIHYLAVSARLAGKRTLKEAKMIAGILLDLDRKVADRKLKRDSHWPLRVQELYAGLSEKDASLHQALLDQPSFGQPDHALFTITKDFPRAQAARRFLERWQREPHYVLNGTIVQLFDGLPAEVVLPTLRKRWGDTGQEAAFLPLLARQPRAEDRGKLLDGLNSLQAHVLEACVVGLERLGAKADAQESFAMIRALNRTSDKQTKLRKMLAERLEKTTGQKFGSESKRWIAWLQMEHPEYAERLTNPDGVDVAKWNKRLARLVWQQGRSKAGEAIFSKASCIQCHSGSQAIGPDLAGVATRFSQADLFTAILQPSKDVPARYQTTLVETSDGKTYQGIVIYDAVDSLILQTGAATTVRLDGAKVSNRSVSALSLMPAGLLDPLSDQDIVDLYAYLKTLASRAP